MKATREAFTRSPRKPGISFTVPASYWYLRWFKVPKLLGYADFTNIVSLHMHAAPVRCCTC